jgi:hypothetical protein
MFVFCTVIMLKYSIVFLLFVAAFSSSAQNSRDELARIYVNVGKKMISEQKYDSAYSVLKSAFIKDAILPDELLYYYSYVLWKRGEVDQSKKMLTKFITLVPKDHELIPKSSELIKALDEDIEKRSVACQHCSGEGITGTECTYCNKIGTETCTLCKGKGRVLMGGSNGMRFGNCKKCFGEGKVNCAHCHGTLIIREKCVYCDGSGKIRTDKSNK